MKTQDKLTSSYDDLTKELPQIAKVVNAFSGESIQKEVFHILVTALGHGIQSPPAPIKTSVAQLKRAAKSATRRGTRQSTSSNPTSARARVDALVDDRYFTVPKSTHDVTKELAVRGFHYESRKVAMALLELIRKRRLRRTGTKGNYEYVNA